MLFSLQTPHQPPLVIETAAMIQAKLVGMVEEIGYFSAVENRDREHDGIPKLHEKLIQARLAQSILEHAYLETSEEQSRRITQYRIYLLKGES